MTGKDIKQLISCIPDDATVHILGADSCGYDTCILGAMDSENFRVTINKSDLDGPEIYTISAKELSPNEINYNETVESPVVYFYYKTDDEIQRDIFAFRHSIIAQIVQGRSIEGMNTTGKDIVSGAL